MNHSKTFKPIFDELEFKDYILYDTTILLHGGMKLYYTFFSIDTRPYFVKHTRYDELKFKMYKPIFDANFL